MTKSKKKTFIEAVSFLKISALERRREKDWLLNSRETLIPVVAEMQKGLSPLHHLEELKIGKSTMQLRVITSPSFTLSCHLNDKNI